VLTLAASLANPYGIRGALSPWSLWQLTRGASRELCLKFSSELRGLDIIFAEHGVMEALSSIPVFLTLLVFAGGLLTFVLLAVRHRFPVYRLLLFAVFAYLTWRMVRNGVAFALVAGVVIRINVCELGELTQRASDACKQGPRRESPLVVGMVGGCLLLLIVTLPWGVIPTTSLHQWPRKWGLGEASWYGHAAARFLQRPGMPDYVYAVHEGQAGVCIYHLGPKKRVFADARVHVHTPETLSRCLAIQRQLAAGDPRAEENLTGGIPPRQDGRRRLPALLFDNETLLSDSFHPPRLLHTLLGGNRWRCVFCDTKQEGLRDDPRLILDGTTVFLPEDLAQALGLPPADPSLLLRVTEMGRHVISPDFRSRNPP
jgi:hypothetical protein